jgi:hypothetical protein
MANLIAWREEKQILLPQGGIRMTCPAAAGAERSVAKNLLLVAAKDHAGSLVAR